MLQSVLRCFFTLLLFSFANASYGTEEKSEKLDDYLWLEDLKGQKSKEWVEKQNVRTEKALKTDSRFQSVFKKNLEILNSEDRLIPPHVRGEYVYDFWQNAENKRGVWRRTTLKSYNAQKPDWDVLLDVDKLSRTEGKEWTFKGVTCIYPDYDLCLVQLSSQGNDANEIREFSVPDREFVENGFKVPEAKASVAWIDKNNILLRTDFGDDTLTKSGYPRIVKKWSRGQDIAQAKTVFEGDVEDVSASFEVDVEVDGKDNFQRNVFIYKNIDFYKSYVYHLGGENELTKLDIPDDAESCGLFRGQLILKLKSNWTVGETTFIEGSCVSLDFKKLLAGEKCVQYLIEIKNSAIYNLSATKNSILINHFKDVKNQLYAYKFDGKWVREKLITPECGSLSLYTSIDLDSFWFTHESFLQPATLNFVEKIGAEPVKVNEAKSSFDATGLETKQEWAVSRDGTRIPYYLVAKKNINKDGKNPTLLTGYGGFEVARKPRYSGINGSSWLERGGVYVLANIRGGGEFGPSWHKAALKENRMRAYEDFIAVAEALIESGITSPSHLGISGGSNGGLLVGASMVLKPDLFRAVIAAVPLLDMKRYSKLSAGASWMAEYGDPDDPEMWKYIKQYSPYHNVRENVCYPTVLFTTATTDNRVHPSHARRMAHKMLDQGHDVWFFENTGSGGHSGGAINEQTASYFTLRYMFLFQQLQLD